MIRPVTLISLLVFLIPTYLVRVSLLGIPSTLFEVFLWITFIYFVYTKHISFGFWKTDPLNDHWNQICQDLGYRHAVFRAKPLPLGSLLPF